MKNCEVLSKLPDIEALHSIDRIERACGKKMVTTQNLKPPLEYTTEVVELTVK